MHKFSGLHTAHNYIGSVPEGALLTADNAVIVSQDTIEPMRGQYPLTYTFGSSSSRANALYAYGSTLIAQYGTAMTRDTGSAFSDYSGTFTPVDDTLCRMRGVEAAQNFYVNTASGVKVLETAAGSFSAAGVPQCLDVFEVGATVSASGYLANGNGAAYRAVVGQKDANGQWHYGAPSQRTTVWNRSKNIEIADLDRNANVVTVTVTPTHDDWIKYLTVGQTVTLNTTEANFPSGVKTVSAISLTQNTFSYAEVGATSSSTIVHAFYFPQRSSKVAVGIPSGVTSSDVIQLFRTETVANGETDDPGEEVYQVGEQNPPAAVSVTAGGVVMTTGVVVVTSNSHPFVVGQSVEMSPADGSLAAGVYPIIATTANTFTYRNQVEDDDTSGGTITYTPRTVVFDDNTPEAMLGDPLYTNPNTGDGLEASRYEPLIAKDMCWAADRLWQFNTTDKQRLELQLLGVGSPDGIQTSDWLQFTIGGAEYRYTAVSFAGPGQPVNRYFRTWSYSTDPGVNVENTTLDLVRTINQDLSATPFYAVYSSGENDVPGKFTIVAKDQGAAAISAQASRPDSWSPILPGDGVTTVASSNDANVAGIAWSDPDQPEAFPLGNRTRAGAKNDPIWRGIELRESLFLFKQKGGLYVLPTNQLPFRARVLDPNCRLLAPDTVVTLNNQIYALTEQGLCSATEAGVDVIGWPLDYDVRALLNTTRSTITRIPFAVSYETERQVWVWLPTNNASTYATQAYVYNHATRTFTRATRNRTAGLVMPGTDILWMGDAEANTLRRERKSFDYTDYSDESTTVSLTAVSGTALTVDSTAGCAIGDLITDGTYREALITAIPSSTALTVSATADWTTPSTLTVYKGYEVNVVTVPQTWGEPGKGKSIGRVVLTFRDAQFQLGKATIATDDAPDTKEYTLSTPGYGQGGYGVAGYGNNADPINRHATLGTTGSLLKLGFKIREARAKWRLLAITPVVGEQGAKGR